MIQLKDLCQKASSNIAQKDLEGHEGQYPIYGASGLIGYVDFYKQENPYVAVVKDGAGIGRVMCLPEKSSVIGTMQYILPNEGVNVHYLAFAMEHMNLAKYFSGATIPHIYFKDYCTERLPKNSEAEQKQISTTLSRVTELISLRKQQLSKLDELVKARFVEMFGDSVANTKNFPSTTLETVMTVFPQNGLYKPQTDYVQDDTGIPILRIDAFYNGKVTNWNTLKRLICSETEIDRYLLKENDIVINRVNSIEYLGKCAHIVGLKEKTVFESNMMRFHMDEKKVNAVYVTEVLCTEDIYRQILRRAKNLLIKQV